MLLRDGQLSIRTATEEDAALLRSWWNDGKVMVHAGFPKGLGASEEEIIASLAKDNDLNQRLILELNAKAIGEMSYRTVDEKIAQIGIKICEAAEQNKGFGGKYLKMLMDYIFKELDYKKIALDSNVNNKRAQKVYERLGFRVVAIRKDSWRNQLGELQSSVDYEISKYDYFKSN